MSYQFIHVESYARAGSKQRQKQKSGHIKEIRKWSIHDIADEAERVPGSCEHVINPQPPVILFGTGVRETMLWAEKWANQAKDAQGRKLRKDGLCLLAGVISMSAEEIHRWDGFKKSAIEYLKNRYGGRLKCVLEHIDEENPHMHFYVVPELGEGFDAVHDGRKAALTAASKGELKGAQNKRYKEAMRAFQDDFSEQVASGHGLTRIGPARRRLTRSEWKSEKDQAQIYARAKKHWQKETEAASDAGLLAYLTPEELQQIKQRRAKQKAIIDLSLRDPVQLSSSQRTQTKMPTEEEKWAQSDPILKAFLDGTLGKKSGSDFSL